MKQLFLAATFLIGYILHSQTDTIFVEFDAYKDQKFVDFTTGTVFKNYTFPLPKVNLDTLSIDGQNSFNGILVTNYKWISLYNPLIFRTTIDSVVNGKSVNQKYSEYRWENKILIDGYYDDSVSIQNKYSDGNIYEKIITYQKDSATTITEVFSYHYNSSHRIMDHYFTVNEKLDGPKTLYLDDSLTVKLEYKDNKLIDILNENTIFLDSKNKTISKDLFFDLANSDLFYPTWFIVDAIVDGKYYRFILCYPDEGNYDDVAYDYKWRQKLFTKTVKQMYGS